MPNPAETVAFKALLDQLDQHLSCAGCNDLEIPNTEEGRAFEKEVHKVFYGEEEIEPTAETAPRIVLNDQAVLHLLAHRLGITLRD